MSSNRLRSLCAALLLILAAIQIRLLVSSWPQPLFGVSILRNSVATDLHATQALLGFIVGGSLVSIGRLLRQGRYLALGWIALIWLLCVAAFRFSPLGKGIALGLDVAVIVGFLCGVVISIACFGKSATRAGGLLQSTSWVLLFSVALNLLLLLMPYSQIVPSGIQEPGILSRKSFSLASKDSVGINSNLIFVAVQHLVGFVAGNSLLSSSLTSSVICAFGLACFALGVRILVGDFAAIAAMLCMLCDGWVLTGAYAGNLTVTLIASSGALFLAFAWALTSQGTRADFIKGGLALLLASFLALYSYAAVRIPWTMSLAVIYCVVAARVALKGGGLARAALSVSALMLPLLALAVVILAVGYGGNTQGLLGDLLVSWPSASVLKHPVAEELSKYVLIHNPDVPIWKQVARPTNGDNFSYIWTRTPGEILAAFLAHTSLILGDRPQYFFLQAPSLLLIVLALVRFPLNDAKVRTATLALLLWAVLWVSSYLLVPDAVAYRRGIAFSAISAALASLAVISASDAKRYKQWLMLGLTVLYCFYSLPQQLVFSNDPETRSRMFTVCSSSFAVRALLSDPQISALSDVPLTVSLAGLENVREAGCVAHATTTSEWKRLLPQAQVDPGRSFENLFELLPAGGPDSVLVYCSPSAHRLPRLAKVCLGEEAGLDTVKTVPVVYGGVFDKWVAFSRK